MGDQLSHVSDDGQISMVNIAKKEPTTRIAVAEGSVYLTNEIVEQFVDQELHLAKGPVFQTAIIAGIMAAKKTGELIPLCHPLVLDHVQVAIRLEGNHAIIRGEASLIGKTGVEMEALTAVTVAALTIYDMCKAMSHEIEIRSVRLIKKSGGKRDFER